MHDYTTTEGRVAALAEIQRMLTAYSASTGRSAIPDAILFDSLVDREMAYATGMEYTTESATRAMSVLIDENKGLNIDPYFWDSLEDQTSNLLVEHGLAADPADDFDD